ncbi:helix-turn-helix domain-containing protein [Fusobacterium simiae]|uniref:Helix-turn-helix domain-containing protein n=1 Tax=Fusobacterium simiae TaxID=855 RepID=A0ABT4DKM4_FUSSI|nr:MULTISPECIES: helix-turn-helix domain-containing protein [Fusobacterium]MCY7009159.1 helix-turn-helix domain-containing protein [Fusobacterium simiae]MDC7955265.1 helix-turn-helix domain-containing protein [Fusobacterium simiae]
MEDLKEERNVKFNCPLELTMDIVKGKWQCVILWHLRLGPLRFGQLQRRLPGVTQKMLSQQLLKLEQDCLLTRKVYPIIPPKVEYSLTEVGESFIPILHSMYSWGKNYSKMFGVRVDTSFYEAILEYERKQKNR